MTVFIPVSYTHLDVYKRQIEYGVNMSRLIDEVTKDLKTPEKETSEEEASEE